VGRESGLGTKRGADAATKPLTSDTRNAGRPDYGGKSRLLRHRDDIQGLRAVAVLLVVLGHAGVGFMKGGYVGVDVFFVLSGFLITGILLNGAAKRGYVSLSEFYVRRARRILPAAVLTLVATNVAAYYLLNLVRARQAVADSIWAALFAANIDFARATDYFSREQPPSPIQHYWSLAVEEQFYLVWPGLLALVIFGLALRRRRADSASGDGHLPEAALHRLLLVILIIGVASLVWSIHATAVDRSSTYFSTFARAWELALGAALAIAAPQLARLPRGLSFAAGWIGVVAIVCAAVLFSDATPFPGYAALLPTLGAALMIGAGVREQQSRASASRALAIAPFRYVGDRSYAFYLWHWPVLIIATDYATTKLSLGAKLLLMLGAFMLSILSYAFFENPIRQMRWRPGTGALLWPASAATVIVLATLLIGSLDSKAARLEAASAGVHPTQLDDPALEVSLQRQTQALPAVVAAVKAALRGAPIPSPLTPAPSKLLEDIYSFPQGCAPHEGETSAKICRLGDTTSPKTLVVFGDSHMQMWMPTILTMAATDNWVVLPIVKSACTPISWVNWPNKPECPAWYRWARAQAKALRPDVTLIAGDWGTDVDFQKAANVVNALALAMKKVSTSVIVLGDPPRQKRQPVDCLLSRNATMKTCSTRITKVDFAGNSPIAAAAKKHHVGFMDTRGWFCARISKTKLIFLCPLVVNRTITRRDFDHITRTYGLALFRPFRGSFRQQLFR
jgi:peptidoglycan/LPS O-acetylase OafA/YrhL